MKRIATTEAPSFAFANKLWVHLFFPEDPKYARLAIACFAIAPLAIGLVIAAFAGFVRPFLMNWGIYYGVFGIFLTTATIWVGGIRQYEIYDRFLACFDLKPEERTKLLHQTLAEYSNTGRQFRSSLRVFTVATAIAAVGFWSPEICNVFGSSLPSLFRFEDFSRAGWYEPKYRNVAFLITLVFALWASVPLATAYRVMLKMPRLLFRCVEKGSALLPRLIKLHFAPLTSFYTRVSLLWTVGIGVFLLLFRSNNNWVFLGATTLLFLLGLINFFVPQYIYARTTAGAEAYWLERAGSELGQFAFTTIAVEAELPGPSVTKAVEIDSYFLTHDTWVYPIHQTYGVLAAQVAAVVLQLGLAMGAP